MNTPKISVVIPTRNRRNILGMTLPTVLGQDLPQDEYEVVVVSDGSSDGTVEFLRTVETSIALRVIDRPPTGVSAARNAGIFAASGELVLLVDDDMLCEPSLLRKHLAAHDGEPRGLVLGPIMTAAESRHGLATELAANTYRDYLNCLESEWSAGSEYKIWLSNNVSGSRSLLLLHGGYDESFEPTEDLELAIRLSNAGVPIRFLLDARVRDICIKSADTVVGEARRLARGDLRVSRRHPGYRSSSLAAGMLGDYRTKRLAWWLCCVLPFSIEPLLRPPCRMAEFLGIKMGRPPSGIRMLQYRKSIAVIRSTMREAGTWQAFQKEFGVMLPVLRYSDFGPFVPNGENIRAKSDRFERHISWLVKRGYSAINPSRWLPWVNEGKELPSRPVLITVDNPTAEAAEIMLSTLRRYCFTACVFVVPDGLGAEKKFQRSTGPGTMTAEQIRHWANYGIEFGIFSRAAALLNGATCNGLAQELGASADNLANIIGARPKAFAYPTAFLSSAACAQVRRVFEIAFSSAPGLNALSTDVYCMRRVDMATSEGIADFAFAVFLGRLSLSRRLRIHRREH